MKYVPVKPETNSRGLYEIYNKMVGIAFIFMNIKKKKRKEIENVNSI